MHLHATWTHNLQSTQARNLNARLGMRETCTCMCVAGLAIARRRDDRRPGRPGVHENDENEKSALTSSIEQHARYTCMCVHNLRLGDVKVVDVQAICGTVRT